MSGNKMDYDTSGLLSKDATPDVAREAVADGKAILLDGKALSNKAFFNGALSADREQKEVTILQNQTDQPVTFREVRGGEQKEERTLQSGDYAVILPSGEINTTNEGKIAKLYGDEKKSEKGERDPVAEEHMEKASTSGLTLVSKMRTVARQDKFFALPFAQDGSPQAFFMQHNGWHQIYYSGEVLGLNGAMGEAALNGLGGTLDQFIVTGSNQKMDAAMMSGEIPVLPEFLMAATAEQNNKYKTAVVIQPAQEAPGPEAEAAGTPQA